MLDVRMVAKEIEMEQQQILANMQVKQQELNRRKQQRKANNSFDVTGGSSSHINTKENTNHLNIIDESILNHSSQTI